MPGAWLVDEDAVEVADRVELAVCGRLRSSMSFLCSSILAVYVRCLADVRRSAALSLSDVVEVSLECKENLTFQNSFSNRSIDCRLIALVVLVIVMMWNI